MFRSKKAIMAGIISALFWGSGALAAGNEVYIEQVGSSNTITLLQAGDLNQIGTSAILPASITGSTNTMSVTQTGQSNVVSYVIVGSNNTMSKTMVGNLNQINMVCGDSSVTCTTVNSVVTITGDSNYISSVIKGTAINNAISLTGDTNTVTQSIETSNSSSSITILGSNNNFSSTMSGTAVGGHKLTADISGASNSHTIAQAGSVDTTVNIRTNGSSNTVTVTTGQ